MKTSLPENSLVIKDRLDAIVQEILAVARDQISMIILFGSYAKGTWVRDWYVEGHITYSYESDLDILVVTKSPKYRGPKGASFESDLTKRLERKGLRGKSFGAPWVTFVVEPIKYLNQQLEKSQYFFSDIKKEGILLYDSGEFTLAEPKDLNLEERKQIAKDDFDVWFGSGTEFLLGVDFYTKQDLLNKAAFLLHQATESFYSAILLVFTGYKPRLHDIEKLGSLASNYSDELLKIFPRDTKEQEEKFVLLKSAYTEARYNKNYKITEEQLLYLIKRIEKLKSITEEICTNRINEIK
ncbi:MAG: HEPN domain-containing protein [Rickettsiaceae bacterium]|jgi:predicted nucleotidyltransferase/HEPN domain-containing protein|nr:HEPN domain-containing protein [Rickettsiaceae bacterium]UCM93513.1 MAG: HEPN domain-containing protein [Candidatus Megaira endosymbiont of Mesostigma viride]HJK88310.1 HEPN domain-containing protein [Candidatus Megaira endosymbiont of Mesostigma viride]